jgi:hypothetical protein
MRPTLLHQRIEDVRVVVRGERDPTDAEFDAHLAEALVMAERIRVVVVVAAGRAQLSPAFRARLVHTGLFRTPHAILTDFSLARAEMASVSRIGANVRVFASSELEQALEFLLVAPRLREAIRQALAAMQREVAEPADGDEVPRRPSRPPPERRSDTATAPKPDTSR